jgi:hypothetical protein
MPSATAVAQQIRQRIPLDKDKQVLTGNVTDTPLPTQGRNASGRTWKVRPQKRASSLIKTTTNNLRKTWAERQAEKRQRVEALELQKELIDAKKTAIAEKKERKLEQEKRRAENEFQQQQRSAQTLNLKRVGTTLKALSKKQLRQIKKTRMNTKTGVVEYVPAYAK